MTKQEVDMKYGNVKRWTVKLINELMVDLGAYNSGVRLETVKDYNNRIYGTRPLIPTNKGRWVLTLGDARRVYETLDDVAIGLIYSYASFEK